MSQNDPILNAIARLGEQEAADSKRKLIDSKKNQTEAMRACANKDFGALQALLAQGLSPNFFAEREGWSRSPLQMCVSNQWSEGVDALLAAGASDGGEMFLQRGKSGYAEPAILTAASHGDANNFFKILPTESDPKLRSEALRAGLQQVGMCAQILSSADGSSIAIEDAKIAFERFASHASNRAHADTEAAMCALLERFPGCCSNPERAWSKALDEDMPKLCKALARAGVSPGNAEWTTPLSSADFPEYWKGRAPSALIHRTRSSYYGFSSIEKARLQCGAIARAARAGSINVLASLLQIAPLKALFEQDEQGREALSYASSAEGLKALAEAGLDLSGVKDAEGRNPLHQACRFGYSKKNVELLCRARPEWVDERDAAGKRPIELCEARDAAAFALIFDKIGLRDAVKGRRGKRTGEAAKPRRL